MTTQFVLILPPVFPLTYIIPFPQPYPLDLSLIIRLMLQQFHTLESQIEKRSKLSGGNWNIEEFWRGGKLWEILMEMPPGAPGPLSQKHNCLVQLRLSRRTNQTCLVCWECFRRNINNCYCWMFLGDIMTTETLVRLPWQLSDKQMSQDEIMRQIKVQSSVCVIVFNARKSANAHWGWIKSGASVRKSRCQELNMC